MRWLVTRLFLSDGEKLVRVKSWKPSWGRWGMEWPVLLIDRRGGQRMTVWPCWTRVRVRRLIPKLFGYDRET